MMVNLDTWMVARGPAIASAMVERHDLICDMVSSRLAVAFPTLCYDPSRIDAITFQQHTFREVPRRFHRVLMVVLNFQQLAVIEREYRWAWGVLPRYGVTQHHLLSQVRWFFQAARSLLPLDNSDMAAMRALETAILEIVERSTHQIPIPPPHLLKPGDTHNGHHNGHHNGYSNGHRRRP